MKKLLRSAYFFISIYSTLGLIALLFLSFQVYEVNGEFQDIEKLYQDALIGVDITSRYDYFRFEGFFIVVLIALSLYFLFFTIQAILLRLRFRFFLKRECYSAYQNGNNLIIKFDHLPWRGFFFIYGQLNLSNLSAGTKRVSHFLRPKSYLHGDEIVFDLHDLPTGKYKIDSIVFAFQDPLRLINAKYYYIGKNAVPLVVYRQTQKGLIELDEQLDLKDAMNAVISDHATEGFYSTREYKPGDEPKKIHWKNTAKTGNLMLRIPEETPVDDSEVNIVLNLYVPFVNICDQTVSVGKFLKSTIGTIELITRNTGKNITLHINGKVVDKLEELKLFDQDKLPKIILSKCETQNFRSFEKFQSEQKLDNMIVFSMSGEYIGAQKTEQRYIYQTAHDYISTFKQRLKNLFFYQKENYFVSLRSFFNLNRLSAILSARKYRSLKVILVRNEKVYQKDKSIVYLN